jgi:crotonobetainyl-CoA:carnitine CoA-transferase CaiB-like acyl-CoA transferase
MPPGGTRASPRTSCSRRRTGHAHRDALAARLNAALERATADDWVRRLTARGVPCGPVHGVDEAVEFAARLGLDPWVDVADDDDRVSRQIRHPVAYSATPAMYRLPPGTR